MTRDEVVELFKAIKSIYPNFEVSTQKVNIWSKMMHGMDYERVMARFEEHVTENKFPPTIAEIAAYAPPKNETLEKIEQWKKEAAEVPPEVKQEFWRKLKILENQIKEKSQ